MLSPELAIALSSGSISLAGVVITAMVKYGPGKQSGNGFVGKEVCDARHQEMIRWLSSLTDEVRELNTALRSVLEARAKRARETS